MLEEFQSMGKKLFEQGLIGPCGGTLSCRDGDKIIITKQGAILSNLNFDDLAEVSFGEGKNPNASIDLPTHLSIYSACDIKVIIHATPIYAMAIAVHEEKIIPLDYYAKQFLKGIPVVRVRDPHSIEEINRFLVPLLKSCYPCSIVRGYGSFSIGKSFNEAYTYLLLAERSCKMINFSKKTDSSYGQRDDKSKQKTYRSAIPPSIGVMDRSYRRKR
ncbi:hypothetical protein A2230_09425 [candidate division WOR-1 bacterium RIFOXYA2_FULL_36_21]|uniref:Class II aldolase/adducin N-terminal domain-containing protein n=1 Tax=candidate division WOR-1 bacterium RIFOXYB2_FULL_36_35 TaxID=1802578 RepID=A0A1F4S3S0_UNCSA|nr:MAG: hypothetical protein A2230_09425 [candidate division WOR-1 bacterium RIFOXYA2_FULL_36_21]OGC15075.1 MAG: hypothetical protein A2290_09245 [candidate division WOR-1 bacterium RIFOXYB2_FULL_36_35]OGC16456.1 MAG: hypothetical protein A2282_03350 [candidate division WOR-1 bacterium RIFOXYA12_FULL_36_13]